MRSPFFLALPALLLAACSHSVTQYPSLLPRANEGKGFAEPVRPAPVATPDATLDGRIGKLSSALDSANAAYLAAVRDAEAKVASAKGAAEGSDRWLIAQSALSALDNLRAPTKSVLADLDRLAIERGTAGEPPYPALDLALARATEIDSAQEQQRSQLIRALAGD